ncbi:WD40-repeat-containing domain protein [Pholiota molesta]|nr:WD40-repeat-containing domain protein [Pholiota molesta]
MAERHKLLLVSPHLQDEQSPKRTTDSDGYALSLSALPGYYAAAIAGTTTSMIDILDSTTLRTVQKLPGHTPVTTSLHTADTLGGVVQKCLVSSGKDGSIMAWDLRSNAHSIKMTNLGKKHALLSCAISPDGLTVAGGTELDTKMEEASILYWDPRQPATPLRAHTSTHSDDITTLSFAPSRDPETNCNIILSGSTDGLLSTSNADEDDEDEAVIQVGNWGCSIAQAGWIHNDDPQKASIWAGGDMETFSTWKSDLDQLLSLDLRAPVLHSGREWLTDYFITARSTSTTNPKLSVFTGSFQGDVALLGNMNTSVPDAPWCLYKVWTHGHSGVVRDVLWDESNQTLVTGGEDGKIALWPITPMADSMDEDGDDDDEDDDDAMDVDVASPKLRKRNSDPTDEERNGKRARR